MRDSRSLNPFTLGIISSDQEFCNREKEVECEDVPCMYKEGAEIVVHNELIKKAMTIAPKDYADYRNYCQMMRESRVKHALLRKRK